MWTDEKSHAKALVELLRDMPFDHVTSDALSERLGYRVTSGEVGAVASYIERLMDEQERRAERVEQAERSERESPRAETTLPPELAQDRDQRMLAFFLAGQLAGLASRSLGGVRPFDLELYPEGYPTPEPAFVLRFHASGHRYRVLVTPEGQE